MENDIGETKDGAPYLDLDDEAFQKEFLEGVAELGEEEGDWRDHLPYEAAIHFDEDDRVREQYSPHVDECAYCQELLETLRST